MYTVESLILVLTVALLFILTSIPLIVEPAGIVKSKSVALRQRDCTFVEPCDALASLFPELTIYCGPDQLMVPVQPVVIFWPRLGSLKP